MSQDPNPNTQNPPQAVPQEKTAEKKRLTPPTTITNLLMYENSCFWYQLSCCDPNAPHIGVLISFDEQPITGCPSTTEIKPDEAMEVSMTVPPKRTTSVAYFSGIYTKSVNTEEPRGLSKPYLIEDYGLISMGQFANRIIKIMTVYDNRNEPIHIGRIIPKNGKVTNKAKQCNFTNPKNPTSGFDKIMTADVEIIDSTNGNTTYKDLLILVE